jgi:GAF domain-containing protein
MRVAASNATGENHVMPIENDPLAYLHAGHQPTAYLNELAALYRAQAGWQMLTLMTFDRKQMLASRIYSSDPALYPVGGLKPIPPSGWVEQVLQHGEIFVANDAQAFRPHYVDWEKLRDLGMESAVNFPATVNGDVIGTVNLTAGAGFYTPARVAAGAALAPLAAVGFLLCEHIHRAG